MIGTAFILAAVAYLVLAMAPIVAVMSRRSDHD